MGGKTTVDYDCTETWVGKQLWATMGTGNGHGNGYGYGRGGDFSTKIFPF